MKVRSILAVALLSIGLVSFGQVETIYKGANRPGTMQADTDDQAWDKVNNNDRWLEENGGSSSSLTNDGIALTDTFIYTSLTSGDDVSGTGTKTNPVRTFTKAMEFAPGLSYFTHIMLDTGTYNMSELLPYLRNNANNMMIVGTPIYTGEVLANTSKDGDFVWSTSTTMTPGALQGSFIERTISVPFDLSVMYPIYDNTASEFWLPTMNAPSLTTAKICNPGTVINMDMTYITNMSNVDFRDIAFESAEEIQINNCSNLYFVSCSFSLSAPAYETFTVLESTNIGLGFSLITHIPTTDAGDAYEYSSSFGGYILQSVILNADTTVRCQGIEIKNSAQVSISGNIVDGFGVAVKNEASDIGLGGHMFNDISDGAISFEEPGYASYSTYTFAITDSFIVVDTIDYMLVEQEPAATRSGRYFALPSAVTAGTFTFSDTYTNHTHDVANSRLISFGTGTMEVYGEKFNVLNYGAISGDGLSDSTAFNDCLAAAVADSGTMIIPKGYYHVPQFGITTAGGIVNIVAEEGAVIDMTSSNESYLIDIRGTLTDSDNLDASPSAADTVITSSLASSLSAGDIVLIKSVTKWHSNATATNQVKSEMCEVRATNGTAIWLKNPLFDGYDADSVIIYKCNFPDVTVKGLTVVGSGNSTGIYLFGAKNINVTENKLSGMQTAAISTQYIYQGSISKNATTDNHRSGYGYGISTGSLQYVNIYDNYCTEARHSIVVGGIGISRMVNINSNHCGIYNPYEFWAIDLHPSAEFVSIFDNTCMGGGIYSECDNVEIYSNKIYTKNGNPILLHLYGAHGGSAMEYINIYNNRIEDNSGVQSIRIRFYNPSVTVEEIRIDGNTIVSPVTSAIQLEANSNAGCVIDILKVTNNIIDVQGGAAGIYMYDADLLVTNFYIKDNDIVGDYASLIYIGLSDSTMVADANQRTEIVGNYIESTGNNEYVVRVLSGNYLLLKNNVITSTVTNAYYMNFTNESHLDIIGNTINDFHNSSGVDMNNGPATAYMHDNEFISCTGSVAHVNVAWAAPADESW